MNDIFLICEKEFKELGLKSFFINFILLILIAGLVVPYFNYSFVVSGDWGVNAMIFIFLLSQLVPFILSMDSFSGEKNCKTLETLISTPIHIESIFLGKIYFVLIINFVIISISFLLNTLTVNTVSLILHKHHLFLYSPIAMYTIFVIGLAISSFITFSCVILSLAIKSFKSVNILALLIGLPFSLPILFKLINQDIDFKFALTFTAIIITIDVLEFLLAKKYFTRDNVMKNI